mgnify:CR=1 FL=1
MNKVRYILTVMVSLLMLSFFIMGHSLVAYDYLHGRGDAAISIMHWGVIISIPLAMIVGYYIAFYRLSVLGNIHGTTCEDKAPPLSLESCKSRDELRIRFKQKRKQFKEERRKAIKEYIDFVMVPFLDDDRSFDILLENIRHWHLSDDKSFRPVPLSPNHRLTSYDIRHFVWNIGERLGWSGIKRAKFAKYCFPEIMKDLEVETIRRTLKQSPENQFSIKIDIPDSKDDYRFHYSNDK